jgi:TP901 family phage tail tape measure protein
MDASLTLGVDTSAAVGGLEALNKQLSETQAKFSGLDQLLNKALGVEGLVAQIKKLTGENDALQKKVKDTADAFNQLQGSIKKLDTQGMSKDAGSAASTLQKLTTEAKEATGALKVLGSVQLGSGFRIPVVGLGEDLKAAVSDAEAQSSRLKTALQEINVVTKQELSERLRLQKWAADQQRALMKAEEAERQAIHKQDGEILLQTYKAQTAEKLRQDKEANERSIQLLKAHLDNEERLIKEQRQRIKEYMKYGQSVDMTLSDDDRSAMHRSDEYGAVQLAAMAENARRTREIDEAIGRGTGVVDKSKDAMKRWSDEARVTHDVARGAAAGIGYLWMTWGNIGAMAAGFAGVRGATSALKDMAEIEENMIQASGQTGESVESLRQRMMSLYKDGMLPMMAGPREVSEAYRDMIFAGFDANKAFELLTPTMKFARVGGLELADAVSTIQKTLNAFSIEKTEKGAYRVADVLKKTADATATSIEGMSSAMNQAVTAGGVYGATLEDVALNLGLLAKVGIDFSAAGTATKNFMAELSAPKTQKAREALQKMGLDFYDVNNKAKPFVQVVREARSVWQGLSEVNQKQFIQNLQDVFGERGLRNAPAILKLSNEELEDLIDQMANATGTVSKLYDNLSNGTKGTWQQVKANLQAVGQEAVRELDSALKDLGTTMLNLVKSDEFKAFLDGLVSTFKFLTTIVVEHGDKLLWLFGLYAGSKLVVGVFDILKAGWTSVGTLINDSSNYLKSFSEKNRQLEMDFGGEKSGKGILGKIASGAALLLRWVPILGVITTAAWMLWDVFNQGEATAKGRIDARIEELKKQGERFRLASGGEYADATKRLEDLRASRPVGRTSPALEALIKSQETLVSELKKVEIASGRLTDQDAARADGVTKLKREIDALQRSQEAYRKSVGSDSPVIEKQIGQRRNKLQDYERSFYRHPDDKFSSDQPTGLYPPKLPKDQTTSTKDQSDAYASLNSSMQQFLTLQKQEEEATRTLTQEKKALIGFEQTYADLKKKGSAGSVKEAEALLAQVRPIAEQAEALASVTESAKQAATYYKQYSDQVALAAKEEQNRINAAVASGEMSQVVANVLLEVNAMKEAVAQSEIYGARLAVLEQQREDIKVLGGNTNVLDDEIEKLRTSSKELIANAEAATLAGKKKEALSFEKYLASLGKERVEIQSGIATMKERILVESQAVGLSEEASLAVELRTKAESAFASAVDKSKAAVFALEQQMSALNDAISNESDEETKRALTGAADSLAGRVKAARAETEKLEEAAKQAGDELAAMAPKVLANRKWKTAYENLSKSLEDSIVDGIMNGFKGGRNVFASFIDTLKREFNNLVLRPVIQAIINPVMGAVAGAFGMSSAQASGGAVGTASNSLSMIQSLKSIYDNVTTGFAGLGNSVASAVSYGQTALGSTYGTSALSQQSMMLAGQNAGFSTSAFASQIGTAASYLGAAATGMFIGNMISGGYSALGKNPMAATGLGTAAGAAIGAKIGAIGGPLGAVIGGTIGGIINRAFGMGPKKVTAEGIEGTFSGDDFAGRQYSSWKQKGGWFRSDKSGTNYSAIAYDVDMAMGETFAALKGSISDFAETLGQDTTAIAAYSKAFKLDLKGLDEAARQAKIDELFAGMANDMAKLAGNLIAFTRQGEQASAAIERLAVHLTSVNAVMDSLGRNAFAASLAGADMANQLADMAGGLEAFTNTSAAYYQNFYSEGERFEAAVNGMRETLINIGVNAIPKTKEAFRALMEAQDLTTASGRATYAALLNVSAGFSELINNIQGQIATLEAEKLRIAQAILSERDGLEKQAETLLGNTTALRERELATIDPLNRSLYLYVEAIESAQAANEAFTAQLAAFAAAGEGIAGFIRDLRADLNGGQGFSRTSAAVYRNDLALAGIGDLEASNRITESAGAYLDMVRATARSRTEYDIAATRVASELEALPATQSWQVQVLEKLDSIKLDAGVMQLDLAVQAKSEIEKLIKFASDTDDLPEDVKTLALATSSTLTRTLSAVIDDSWDSSAKQLAFGSAGGIARRLNAIVNSSWTDEAKQLAFQQAEDLSRALSVVVNTADETQLKDALAILNAASGSIDKTLNLSADVSTDIASSLADKIDLNLDGYITKDELETVMKGLGLATDLTLGDVSKYTEEAAEDTDSQLASMRAMVTATTTNSTRLVELNTTMSTLAATLSDLSDQEKLTAQINTLQNAGAAQKANLSSLASGYGGVYTSAQEGFIKAFTDAGSTPSTYKKAVAALSGLDEKIAYINTLNFTPDGWSNPWAFNIQTASNVLAGNYASKLDASKYWAWYGLNTPSLTTPANLATDTLATLRAEDEKLEALREQIRALGGIPQFAVGTNYVPEDMTARIHKGERIIPAADNTALMDALTRPARRDAVLVEEIRRLREEVAQLRTETRATATHTAKTARLLDRVMPDGDALSVRTAT